MNKSLKKLLIFTFIVGVLSLAGYIGYRSYHYIIEDATKRIQQGVAKGVKRGIIDVVNPFKWIKR